MGGRSKIEWTDITWNPVTGCTKISAGCRFCYAERMANRLHAMGQPRYKNGFLVTLHHDLIEQPLRWSKPRRVFVNSMSDLFHERVPTEFIRQVFNVMARSPHHIFQILTKRSERLRELSKLLGWPENVWMGVTIENDTTLHRMNDLMQVPCNVRFLSCEPLLGPLNKLHLQGIQWVIVGGESGPGARPMQTEWVDGILRQCETQQVPFFFKQWGGFHKKLRGRTLHGRIYDGLPGAAFAHLDVPTPFQSIVR